VSAEGREKRLADDKPSLPPVVTLDRSQNLDLDVALRGEDSPPLVVYVPSGSARSDSRVTWRELPRLDVASVMQDAREELGARIVVAEGGPRLIQAAFDEEVVTDLSLTVGPTVVGKGPRLFATSEEPAHSVLLPPEVIDGYVFAHWVLSTAADAHVNGRG
jgi:riboflavin biosynthesis pyrimidine reductase